MAAGPKAHQPAAPSPKVNMPDIAQLLESAPPLAAVSLAQPLPLEAISSPPPLAAIIAPPPGGGGVVIPPGGGGPVTFPTELPREPVTQPSAVPEPATWAMMLLGFGLIGWRVRAVHRRSPRTAATVSAIPTVVLPKFQLLRAYQPNLAPELPGVE